MLENVRVPERIGLLFNRIKILYQVHVIEKWVRKNSLRAFISAVGGHIIFQTLYAAVKLDLFTILDSDPGLTTEEIASKLNLQEQPARILLLGLLSAGLLKKKRSGFYNTFASRRLLSKRSSANVISYVLLENNPIYQAAPFFLDALKENANVGIKVLPGEEPTFYQRMAHVPEIRKIFQDAMQELSAQSNAPMIQLLDLSKSRFLVDVGGGNGTNIMALAKRFPHLKAAVFDLPHVCEMAQAHIAANHMAERCTAIPGDCFKEEFPKGADAFLFCHFFTMWSKAKDLALLEKAFRALPLGGRAIIFNMMQENNGTGPISAAIGSPYFLTLASGEGMLYSWQEYITCFKKAGFSKVRTMRLPYDHGIIVGVK